MINPDGTLTYTPDSGASDLDTFTYTVTSGAVIETTTVTINVATVLPPVMDALFESNNYLVTSKILPVHAEPALFVLQSVSDTRNEMLLRSGLGVFQTDSVMQAELLNAFDAENTFASGSAEGSGALIGRDFSLLQPLRMGTLDQPNALYVQHAVRHESLGFDNGIYVQAAVRASQLESMARGIPVTSYNSATTGVVTLLDPFALGAPLPVEKMAFSDEGQGFSQANSTPTSLHDDTGLVVPNLMGEFPGDFTPLAVRNDVGSPALVRKSAPGFSAQLDRDAARMRPYPAVTVMRRRA